MSNQAKVQSALLCFHHIAKRYFFFHVAFIALMTLLVTLFVLFFSFFANSFLMAVVIAFFFFSIVMYFILRLYAQEQKPRQFIQLAQEYMNACRKEVDTPKELANLALQMAESLNNVAHMLYSMPESLSFLQTYCRPLFAFCYWRDVHQMKELFLLAMIDELKENVKAHPTNPDAHKELAKAYLLLSKHYREPLSRTDILKPTSSDKSELQAKFQFVAKCAIEEFSILKEYAPKDPWVHEQLAIAYHDCNMPEKEIEAYETLSELHPDDSNALTTLGILYFKAGLNGKGLKVYEKLKSKNSQKAEELISYYGGYLPLDPYRAVVPT